MKAAFRSGILLFLLFVMGTIFVPVPAEAQNDYPIPPGNPSGWGIPGKPKTFVPEERRTSPPTIFSAPAPPGNEELNRPSAPAGEAQEKYTGTRDRGFGGIAGTGIDESRIQQNR
jgi:hypothetical protein